MAQALDNRAWQPGQPGQANQTVPSVPERATPSQSDAYRPPAATDRWSTTNEDGAQILDRDRDPNAFPAAGGWSQSVSPDNRGGPDLRTRQAPIQRQQLAPIGADGEVGLPSDLWRGMSIEEVEKAFAGLNPPPASPALHSLWRKLVTTDGAPPAGASAAAYAAVRARALYKSGLLGPMSDWLTTSAPTGNEVADAVLTLFRASADLGLNKREAACGAARDLSAASSSLPAALKGDAILIAGYCAAVDGNRAAAGLTADLAREAGLVDSPALGILDAVAAGRRPPALRAGRTTLIDYRIAEIAKATPAKLNADTAETALLVAISNDTTARPELRLTAGEAAFQLNAIDLQTLAAIYRDAAAAGTRAAGGDAAMTRATAFARAETAASDRDKAEAIAQFVSSAENTPFALAALRAASAPVANLAPRPGLEPLAELAIMAALAGDRTDVARQWADLVRDTDTGRMAHWSGLVTIATPPGPAAQSDMMTLERAAIAGVFAPDLLHRIATVLDAFAYQVPIPLWEAASRTPQPATGFLPPTGMLASLNAAAKEGANGRTVLLAMQSLGPDGPRGTNMLALGDTIRGLLRADLKDDARRVAVEALLLDWPTSSGRVDAIAPQGSQSFQTRAEPARDDTPPWQPQ